MGVSLLLDTHAVIWLAGREPESARPASRELWALLSDASSRVLVSAVSAFEVSTKVRLGKLDQARDLAEHWNLRIRMLGADQLPMTADHAIAAGSLDWAHRDPFDRLLVAQAIIENLTLVSADEAVLRAPGVRLLPW